MGEFSPTIFYIMVLKTSKWNSKYNGQLLS
jgi:hypothetical protein